MMPVTYKSQRIAYPYFVVALCLFALQIVAGIWLAISYAFTLPQGLVEALPFSTMRAFHTNLLVLWMLLGFMGGTYFMVPEESKSEIFSTKLAWFQLILLTATGVAALVGFLFGWTKGRPLLEIPFPLNMLIVLGALVFLFNIGMTLLKARNWTMIQGTLLSGLVLLALLYLFGVPFYKNLSIDWYYWWWVIHLWVEGAWELITSAIMAWVLMRITGVERKTVEKWLYVEIGLFMFTGLAGTGHHYYWIGAPDYWLAVGGIFSALEPFPILLMVWDTFQHTKHSKSGVTNKVVWTLVIACSIMHLIGAGVFGFIHTLPQVNYYTHGSQVTVSHGHLAFYGAYALLNLTIFYYAFPRLHGVERFRTNLGHLGFWITLISMSVMGLAFGVAGVIQSYVERVFGLGFMTAQAQMQLWFKVVIVAGLCFAVGLGIIIYDLLSMGRRARAESGAVLTQSKGAAAV
jgi:nitric oxide reductase subunit B